MKINKSENTIIAKTSHESVTPRKANLVLKSIVGMHPQNAIDQLELITKRAAKPIIKILKQAIGNAVNQHKSAPDKLVIKTAFATKGRTLKHIRFAGRGRVKPYQKIASHITIILRVKKDRSSDSGPVGDSSDVRSVKINKDRSSDSGPVGDSSDVRSINKNKK